MSAWLRYILIALYTAVCVQEISDEDLAAGLGLLADRLHKPSRSNDNVTNDSLEVPGKQSSMAIVTMPTELKPHPQTVTSSTAANQTALITDLSTPDWSMLLSQPQAGTQPPVTPTQGPGTTCDITSAPWVKKVIRLVVKRPTSSTISQSQSCSSAVG